MADVWIWNNISLKGPPSSDGGRGGYLEGGEPGLAGVVVHLDGEDVAPLGLRLLPTPTPQSA